MSAENVRRSGNQQNSLLGGKTMQFKRKEGFRFVFNQPLDTSFKLLLNGEPVDAESYSCEILDISPRGIKMFSEAKIGEYINKASLQIEIQFILDVTTIQAVGEIVWSKPYGSGHQFGVVFHAQEEIDELIISEMKLRRKKEVLLSKRK